MGLFDRLRRRGQAASSATQAGLPDVDARADAMAADLRARYPGVNVRVTTRVRASDGHELAESELADLRARAAAGQARIVVRGAEVPPPPGPPPHFHAPGAPAAEDPALAAVDARLAALERLAALHAAGILSDAELADEKARLLDS